MVFSILLFIIGLILLIKGGDWFVDGATGIAHRFHVPELLIGATVVSIGTTLPEVMVSATSAVTGHGEIAYGNAIGSVICNTSLIAAITMALRPSEIDKKTFKIPVIFFFAAAVFYAFVAYTTGYFSRFTGSVLLAVFVLYMIMLIMSARKASASEKNDEIKDGSVVKSVFWLIFGAVLIAVGARLLVDNGTIIAKNLGVPEAVIALTLVALGTSLPELVTAVTALVKGHSALSLGNIIGANFFNIVLVSGAATVLSPFDIPQSRSLAGINSSLAVDIPVMFAVMLIMTVPTLKRGKISRWQGILLLMIYFSFCIFQFCL